MRACGRRSENSFDRSSANRGRFGPGRQLQNQPMTYRRTSLILLPLAAAVSAAYADDGGQTAYTTLDTSVVSAAGYAQDTSEAPASVSVITEKELASKPITDIGSAVGDVPGVDISQNKMGAADISIRGFGSNYTMILVDGRRQNTSESMVNNGFDPGRIFMPPVGAIERIEVIRGPASTIYGSDAVGGVVNIITKKHVDQFTGTISIDRTQFQNDDDYGNRWGTGVFLGIPLKENVASLLLRGRYLEREASHLRKPNATAGKNPYATHSPTDGFTGNIGGRLNLTINDSNDVYADLDFTRYKGGAMNTSGNSYQTYRWWNKYNGVVGHKGVYDIGTLESYVQYNALEQVKTLTSSNDGNAPWTTKTGSPMMSSRTWTAATKLVSPIELGSAGSIMLSSGLEANYETFEDAEANSHTALAGKTLDQTTLVGFMEGEYFINDEWIATLGGRVHWSDIFGAHLSPRAYLVYKPAQFISFKGGVANGYKTPQVKKLTDGIYNYSSGRSNTVNYGNPDLKPEESWSYELSTTLKLADAANLTVGLFYTDFKNMLDQENIGKETIDNKQFDATKEINHGKVTAKGLEVLLNTASFHGFRFTGGYTYTHAEIKEGAWSKRGGDWANSPSKRPNELPRHSLTARIDYEWNDFSAYVKSVSKFDSEQQNTKGGPNVDKYKNYTLVDLGASYVFKKQHRFSVAVNNIFDTGLEWVPSVTAGSYANAYKEYIDGRNFWFSYAYSF